MDVNISNEKLSEMIDNILNNNTAHIVNDNKYVDEKAEAFIKSLKDMVK